MEMLCFPAEAFRLFAFVDGNAVPRQDTFCVSLLNFWLLPEIFVFSISIMFAFRLRDVSFCIRLFNYSRHTAAIQDNSKEILQCGGNI